jgi:hypothetical protein
LVVEVADWLLVVVGAGGGTDVLVVVLSLAEPKAFP